MSITGKALLMLERTASFRSDKQDAFQWDVEVKILSESTGGEYYLLHEDFGLITYDHLPAPAAAYKMKIGDRITVAVTFELRFIRGDGWSVDDDIELYYRKERVLKRRPYNPRSERKNYRTGQCWSYPNRRHEARRF